MSNLDTMSPLLLSENIRFQQFPLLFLSFIVCKFTKILVTAESCLSCSGDWRARKWNMIIFTSPSNVIFTSEPYCSYRIRASLFSKDIFLKDWIVAIVGERCLDSGLGICRIKVAGKMPGNSSKSQHSWYSLGNTGLFCIQHSWPQVT